MSNIKDQIKKEEPAEETEKEASGKGKGEPEPCGITEKKNDPVD